jgi:hypothetical protein
MAPSWPPVEVTVSCGLAPSVAHLRRSVCGVLGGLSADRAVLYKYSLQTCSWSELKPGLRVEGTGAAGRPVGLVKRIENVLDPPYSMKEGDLLCAFEVPSQDVMMAALQKHLKEVEVQSSISSSTISSSELAGAGACTAATATGATSGSIIETVPMPVPMSMSSAVPANTPSSSSTSAATPTAAAVKFSTTLLSSAPSTIITAVSRPEDRYLQLMRQQEKIDKKTGVVSGFRHMKNRKEIILSLGGDLNFSDDDSEDE